MLSERFRYEKQKLRAKLQLDEHAIFERNSASCCVFVPEILGLKCGFTGWQEALPIIDSTSFFLDMELLQNLLTIVLVDPQGLQQVRSKLLLSRCFIYGCPNFFIGLFRLKYDYFREICQKPEFLLMHW